MFTQDEFHCKCLIKRIPIALPIILGITLAITDEDSGVSNEENLESTKSYAVLHQLRAHPGRLGNAG